MASLTPNESAPNEEITQSPPSLETAVESTPTAPKSLSFWLIFACLLISTFISALDLTAISTALPKIAETLNSSDYSTSYSWIGNAYSIAAASIVPWSGGLADAFGRRTILLSGLASFLVGSAICGAANTINLLVAGRTFQGLGSGIILCLVEIILADLVPLAERGSYQGAFGAVWALASALGPPLGGAFANTNYRWLFYMNLFLVVPVSVIVFFCLRLKTPPGTLREKLGRLDFVGNLIFLPAIVLLTIGLVTGGQQYSWTDAHVLAPLIIGAVGLGAWYMYERYVAKHPTVPFELLGNWTTTIGYITTFLQAVSALALFYYWPVYFQASKGASPIESAVDFFPVAFIVAPSAMVAGATIGIFGIYKPHNIIAWILMTLGPGLLYLVKADSSKALWVALPIPFSIGIGILFPATSFPVLAPLNPNLHGRALSFLVWSRNLGNILGITIGSTVLGQELAKKLPAAFISSLPNGDVSTAYSFIPSISSLPEPLLTEVRVAFADSLGVIWLVLIPIGAIGLGFALFMKQLELMTEVDPSYGMKDSKKKDVEANEASEKTTNAVDGKQEIDEEVPTLVKESSSGNAVEKTEP